jgi:hypothetical protein
MAEYIFDFSKIAAGGGRSLLEQATDLLRARMWGIGSDTPHRDALAPGDLILIYVGAPDDQFVGHATLASAVRDWAPPEAQAYPGDSQSGVLLAQVEEWDPPVAMKAVLPLIDPAGSNPYVQANARAGFKGGVVRITDHEYRTVLAVGNRGGSRPAGP